MKYMLLAVAVVTGACAASPVAPAAVTLPAYVVVGDSIGLLGPWWPAVEATLPPHTFQNTAIGSTYLHTDWQPLGRAWTAMLTQLAGTTPTAFLVHIGANDTIRQPAPTEAEVFADLTTLAAALEARAPNATIYLAEVGQVWTYGDKRAENAQVLAAIHHAWSLPHVVPGPLMQDLTPDDGVHFTSPANAAIIGARWQAVLR